jgi:hypothetical protein
VVFTGLLLLRLTIVIAARSTNGKKDGLFHSNIIFDVNYYLQKRFIFIAL